MKKLALACAFSALSFSAIAADLPNRKGPPVLPVLVAPAFTWTGFYAGLNAGYADPTAKFSVIPGGSWATPLDPDVPFFSAASPGILNAGSRHLGMRGFTGGAQLGYNYQINNIVLGVEADANALSLKSSYQTPVYTGVNGGLYSAHGSARLDAFYTLRARLGLAANNWLFYVTGGLAVTSEKFSQSINYLNVTQIVGLPITTAAGGANAGRASSTAASWTLGGGVEYAFNNQWSAKAEYLYVNLKSMQFGSVYQPGNYSMQHRLNLSGLNIFRVGLNYRFGS